MAFTRHARAPIRPVRGLTHGSYACPASRTIIVDVRITCRPINDCGCIVFFSCAQCYCILYCILCSCNKTSVVYDAANGECNGKCSLHDIELVEKVQRRFTKRLRGLRKVSYSGRLVQLGLHTLELRRLHLNLLFCYKIVFGLVNINCSDFFQFSVTNSTRGHKYKLFKPRCTSSLRQKFFVDRVINVWNALPPTVNFSKLCTFRTSIVNVDFSRFLVCNFE